MASIKEIAKLAEVSITTASLVLNGKGNQMRISKSTQERVEQVAREVAYQPNISARRLRSEGEKVLPVIAILWTLDTRASLISRFLDGIKNRFISDEDQFELLIQPYEISKLDRVSSLKSGMRFNGAIIANPSNQDMDYLENHKLNVPIVLYQRESSKYSTVTVDGYKSGARVANLFANRGHKTIGLVIPDVSSQAVQFREDGFINTLHSHGLRLSTDHVVFGNFSEKGGYEAAKSLIEKDELPSALFFLSDQMAMGALKAFYHAGINVPGDVEIMGHDNYEHTLFSIPSLSTVHLPVEEMADACMNVLIDSIEHKIVDPVSISFDTSIVIRQSCGDFITGK